MEKQEKKVIFVVESTMVVTRSKEGWRRGETGDDQRTHR
jgi:hypothetical protein